MYCQHLSDAMKRKNETASLSGAGMIWYLQGTALRLQWVSAPLIKRFLNSRSSRPQSHSRDLLRAASGAVPRGRGQRAA